MNDGDLELRVAWQRHVGTSDAATDLFRSVVARHGEPHRHYHDVRHVRWVVRHGHDLAEGRDELDVGAVIVAAFFHDAIYDPTATDNEEASARLATDALRELGWSDARVGHVATMIVGTVDHRWERAATLDEVVLFAADLGVLAANPAGYSDYVRNVRREYHHVSDADWTIGRADVLRSFISREHIYAPSLGLDEWERRARGNLAAELHALER